MAVVHKATLEPSKGALMAAWLERQDWYDGPRPARPRPAASYRFDDPAGEVGIEGTLIDVEGSEWHVVTTYRGADLDGADAHLVGESEHSVLGHRWTYDAAGDPVALAVLTAAVRDRSRQADVVRDLGDGTSEPVPPTVTVRGTGGDGERVELLRRPEPATESDLADRSGVLLAERDGAPTVVLARLR